MKIIVEKATPEKLNALKTEDWTPWECTPATFEWAYSATEISYIQAGRALIKTPKEKKEIVAGDIVTFPKGLRCTWDVIEKIKKVYIFQ